MSHASLPPLTAEQFDRVCTLFGELTEEDAQAADLDGLDEAEPVLAHLRSMLRFHGRDTSNGASAFGNRLDATIRDATHGWTASPVAGMPETIGPFRVIRHVATGGMGTVYEVEQPEPKRRVALKLIRTDMLSPVAVRRFEREAAALARMSHPGITTAHTYGRLDTPSGTVPYLVMEFIDGVPITEYVRKHALDRRATIALLRKVFDAVQYAHGKGVIHRDLKPGNILVDAQGRPHVLDFGVAAMLEEADPVRTRATASFSVWARCAISPEAVAPQEAGSDVRVDVFALAAIAFELLAGESAYDVDDLKTHEVLAQVSQGRVRRFARCAPDAPRELDAILHKALALEPAERYATVAAFDEDLGRFLRNEPITARSFSRLYQLRKFVARNRGVVALLGLATLGLVTGLVLALVSRAQEIDARNDAARLEQRSRAIAYAANMRSIGQLLAQDRPRSALLVPTTDDGGADAWETAYVDARLHEARMVGPHVIEGAVHDVDVTHDGQLLALVQDDAVVVRELPPGKGSTRYPLPDGLEASTQRVRLLGAGSHVALEADGSTWVLERSSSTWRSLRVDDAPLEGPPELPYLRKVSRDRFVLLDAARGGPVAFDAAEPLAGPAVIDPRGRVLWVSPGGELMLQDPRGGLRAQLRLPPKRPRVIAADARDRFLVSARNEVRFWNLRDLKKSWTLEAVRGEVVMDVVFTANGGRAAVLYESGLVRIVDPKAGRLLAAWFDRRFDLRGEGPRRARRAKMTFVHGGGALLTATERLLAVWHSPPRPQPGWVLRHTRRSARFGYVYAVAFHPRGRYLASGGWDGSVVLWDAWTGRQVRRLPLEGFGGRAFRADRLGWSPDGDSLVAQNLDGHYVWFDPWTGERLARAAAPGPLARLPGDGRALVRVGDRFRTIELLAGTGGEAGQGKPRPQRGLDLAQGRVPAWAFAEGAHASCERHLQARDGRAVAVGSWLWGGRERETLVTWSPDATPTTHRLPSQPLSVCIVPGGRRAFVGLRSGTALLWNLDTGLPLLELEGHEGYVMGLSLSSLDGTLATASEDGTVRLWHTIRVEERARRMLAARAEQARLAKTLAAARDGLDDASAARAIRAETSLPPEDRDALLAQLARDPR